MWRDWWAKAWSWLEQHLPDMTEDFEDDDVDMQHARLTLRAVANPADLPELTRLIDDSARPMRPTVVAAVVELVKLGFTAERIRGSALAATLSLSGPSPERAQRAAVAVAILVHRFGLDAEATRGTPSAIRALSIDGEWA